LANPLLQNAFSNATAPAGPAREAASQAVRQAGQAAMDATQNAMPPSSDMWGGYFQALGAVFLLLAALALGFYLLKRYGPKAGLRSLDRGSLKMEAQLPLGPKRSVAVVRFLNKRLVLGVTETQINLLTSVEADHAPEKSDFSETLAKVQKGDSSS